MNRPLRAALVIGLFSALSLAALGCGAQSAPSTSADAPPPIAHVHTTKCGSCHTPPAPKTRAPAKLDAALARHRAQRRAVLTPEQWDAMRAYLVAPEAQPGSQAPSAP